MAPDISDSTREIRLNYVHKVFPCRGNCGECKTCKKFHGREPVTVFAEYIDGRRSFEEIEAEYI